MEYHTESQKGEGAAALYINSTLHIHVMLINQMQQPNARMVLKQNYRSNDNHVFETAQVSDPQGS